MHRASDSLEDPVPHLVLERDRLGRDLGRHQTAGGKMDGDPRPFGNAGMLIGFAVDPAGNRLELIQPPKQ